MMHIGEKIYHSVPVWVIVFDRNGNIKATLPQYIQHFIKYFDNNTAEEIVVTEKDVIAKAKTIFDTSNIQVSYCPVPARITNFYDYMNAKY